MGRFTDVTAKGCTLSWSPPVCNGGSDILYYIISKCDTTKLSWEVINSQSETTSFKVIRLQEGHEYVFRIKAVNATGVSPFLQSQPFVPKHSFGVPNPAGKPEPVRTHFNSITIKWNEPDSDGGSKITGYHVERLKDKGQRWAHCNEEAI